MSAQWQQSTLGESCEMYQPKTIARRQLIPDGKYPVYGANGVIGRYNTYNHSEDQLLITCRGATCGAVNLSSGKCWITGNAMVVKPRTKSINLDYLAYYFMGGVDLSAVITGSAQPQITRQSLNSVLIVYPDLNEQNRIVSILKQALKSIKTATQNTLKNLANTEELFASLLQLYLKAPHISSAVWTETTLGESSQMYQPKGLSKKEFIPDGLYPVYGANGIIGRYNQYNQTESQVLVTCRGATCGRVNQTVGKCWVTSNAMVIQPDTSRVCRDYLAYYLKGGLKLTDFITGSAQPQLTRRSLQMVPLRYPSLNEQKEIVSRLKDLEVEVDAMKSSYQKKLDKLSQLKASIFHKAFSGKL